jgi:hypothetical protein
VLECLHLCLARIGADKSMRSTEGSVASNVGAELLCLDVEELIFVISAFSDKKYVLVIWIDMKNFK